MEQPNFIERNNNFFSLRLKDEIKNYAKLAIPMFFTQLATQLIGVASVIMAGNYSSDVLSGILLANSVWFPVFIGLGGILFFVTALVAQLNGAKKMSEIGPLVRQALWLVIPIIIVIILALNSTGIILQTVGVEKNIISFSEEYLSTFVFAVPAILFSQPLRSLSEGITRPLPLSVINFIMLGIHVIASYCLIFGNLGFPEMGAKGAGLAAVIATWTSLAILVAYIRINKVYEPTKLFDGFEWPTLKILKDIIKGGLPVGLSNFVEVSMFAGASLTLGRLGSEVIAAHGISLNIGGIFFMVPLSIGLAAAVRVGNKVGAKDLNNARYAAFSSIRFGVIAALINTFIILMFADFIVNFYTQDTEVIKIAVILLMFAAFFQIPDSLAMCAVGSLRGYKDTLVPMLIMILSYWVLGFPLGYSLAVTDFWAASIGAPGMWSGMTLGLCIAAALTIWRLNITSKKFIGDLS